ncbi:MAG: hypothetical protein JWN14_3594 [Chthonomonadales bacterium]|nr:hypothetical protein [Chthonomonadales bacterium]
MSNRMSLTAVGFLAFALLWNGVHSAHSQEARKTALAIGYPNPALIINGSGTRYGGIIYVSVYAADRGPAQGGAPVVTSELTPSARSVWQLPLGTYEVRYEMRTGSEMKTFIVRDVILRPEGASVLTVEMNADAKTTIVGGDMSVREMEEGLRRLTAEVAELKKKVNP